VPDTRGTFYPIVLRLRDRRVLVVGGGKVAARKAGGLAEAGARVLAVSPEFTPAFRRLAETRAVTCVRRPYESGDVAGAALVVAATDDLAVNARVRADARRAGILVSVADDPEHSDFFVPAVVRRGDLLLAISTGGGSPALAGDLRRELDALVPADWEILVRLLAQARGRVRQAITDPARRQALMRRLVKLDLLSVLRKDGPEAVLKRIEDRIALATSRRGPRARSSRAERTPARPGPAARLRRAAPSPAGSTNDSRGSGRGRGWRAALAGDGRAG
jgi:precorrin-2 dehydrogenase/sirohydrochlorin ferrochelatase